MQEKILRHYEENHQDLPHQIQYWKLEREEAVLQFFARQQGINRLGLQAIPSQASSEHRAKAAIEMQLALQSMANSPYGEEPWSLTEVSRERYLTPPDRTFKKEGIEVRVKYGPQPTDFMPYVLWKWIYYQGLDDLWHKTVGRADHNGLFYEADGEKIYYQDFNADARRFGFAGPWTVHVNSDLTSYSLHVPRAAEGDFLRSAENSPERPGTHRPPRSTSEASAESPVGSPSPGRRRGRGRGTPFGSDRGVRRRLSTPSTPSHSRSRSPAVRRRGEERGRGRGLGPGPGFRFGERPKPTTRPRSTSRSPAQAFPSPEEVGRRHLTPERGTTRLARLIEEARDPPIVLIRGPANSVKCLRYRLKSQHSDLFHCVSSTFTWMSKAGKVDNSRIMLSFLTSGQRDMFLDRFRVPKGMTMSLGQLDAL